MRVKVLCCAALLGLLASPGLADILVSVDPAYQEVNIAAGTATVDLLADIPEADAIIAFGMDLDVLGGSVSFADFTPGPLFNAPAGTPDGDGIAGFITPFDDPVWGGGVVLGTATLSLDALGLSGLTPGATVGDLTEGFALVAPGEFATAVYTGGEINVVPEPAALALLALSALVLRRR